jgi:agmatine deiminase
MARHYHMPAEWEPHQGTWLSWPHNPETWPGCLEGAERALADAVVALATGEIVHVNVRDAAARAALIARLAGRVPQDRVRCHEIPTNDAWCRDHGAIFVRSDDELVALDFRFNAWGGKYPPFDLDDAAGARMATALGVACERIEMILEGGSIEVNGAGTVLTTEQCLLNPNRNPALSRREIESALQRWLGVSQVVWLGDGIDGDDTDGHIDDITRFVAADTVVTAVEPDPADVNHAPLAENLERLRAVRLPDGRALSIVELPMPDPLVREGRRLPASYANFYIGNEVVLVPTFGCARDAAAVDVLARCFPGRRMVPIDCRDVVVGLGTFHCLTQQVPRG